MKSNVHNLNIEVILEYIKSKAKKIDSILMNEYNRVNIHQNYRNDLNLSDIENEFKLLDFTIRNGSGKGYSYINIYTIRKEIVMCMRYSSRGYRTTIDIARRYYFDDSLYNSICRLLDTGVKSA